MSALEKMPDGKILFYNKPGQEVVEGEAEYYFLTNFATGYPFYAPLPTKIDSRGELAPDTGYISINGTNSFQWETSEHLFQALKYSRDNVDLNLINQIIKAPGPNNARKLGQTVRGRTDWHNNGGNYRLNAMRWVVKQKFQNPVLKQKLLATGNKMLVENTKTQTGYNDDFWGNGHSGNGANYLGKILEETRTELQTSGWTPPTPPSTPPSTPPPSPVPNVGQLNNTEIHVFEAKIKTELNNKGITDSDLSSRYQDWFNYMASKKWKPGELDNYENELKKEIKRVVNKKNQPNTPPAPTPLPKANQEYRDKWIQYLEKEFQELDFGNKRDEIVEKLSVTKDKIKSNELDNESKVEETGTKFLDILKKLGKSKPTPNSQNPSGPSVPENEKPTELTPEEESSLLNQLDNLNQEMPEDSEKEEEKPVEISVIKNFFQANNNINSITLEDDGDLTIEFQDKTTQRTLANNEQLQQIKKYIQQNNERSLNREKLNNISQNFNHQPTNSNYLFHILVVGGLIILVISFALIIFRQRRIKKRK